MVEWWRIIVAVVCLCLSGLFSGLTLGLFALDLTDLDILLDSGTEKEKTYAKKIYPLRKRGNYLLCTLLIGNTAVNSALAIVTAELFGGISGFLASTFLILYVGEIIPQSVCHKYGLVIGAYASPLVYMFMLLTFPLSWPTAKVLDWFLGGESPVRYDKTQLQSLVTLHGSTAKATLSEDETRILNAALMFAQKNIEQIMTPLSKVFMLEVHEHLDSKNLLLVFQSGHSRIPVYERDRHNILGVLFAKDILLIDPEDNIPVSTVMNFFKRELKYSFNDTRLDKMLNEFETGRGHLAVVQKVISFGQGDPYYETIGIVTLEDVIEELIGSEIVDETDVYESNSSTKMMNRKRYIDSDVLRLFSHDSSTTSLQDNEVLAVSSFLSTHLEEFSSRKIPPEILRQLLKESRIVEYRESPAAAAAGTASSDIDEKRSMLADRISDSVVSKESSLLTTDGLDKGIGGGLPVEPGAEKSNQALLVYKRNVPAMEATLIITGRLEVFAGSDGIHSEVGPWTLLGAKALVNDLYQADFTARVIEYPVRMLKIHRKQYRNAINRTRADSFVGKSLFTQADYVRPARPSFEDDAHVERAHPSSRESSDIYSEDDGDEDIP